MISIRDEQLKVFEQMTLFQQRILCHRLPRSFDPLKENITDQTNHTHLQNKSFQEAKRQQLNRVLEHYETSLLDNENHYQQELCHFEKQLWRYHYSENKAHCDLMVQSVQDYLNHRQRRTMQTIRYGEACVRTALRKLQRRQTSQKNNEKNKGMVSVYPQVILDVSKTPLNKRQLDFLSHRGKSFSFAVESCPNSMYSF